MPSFGDLLIVVAVAFAAPFLLGLFPRVRLPSVVLEIVIGIIVGPSVLGWVHIDTTIQVVSSLGLSGAGLVDSPLLVAIALASTSLGVLIPVLKDAGASDSPLGQLVIAAGSIADFGAIILLSLFFSGEGSVGSTLILIGSLLAF